MRYFAVRAALVAAIIAMIISGYKIFSIFASDEANEKIYEQLREKSARTEVAVAAAPVASADAGNKAVVLVDDEPSVSAQEPVEEEIPHGVAGVDFPAIDIDLTACKEMNPDTVGFIYVPYADVEYPVVQGSDNEFYLNHSFDGSKNANGSIFVGAEYNGFSGLHTVVYGHNMKSGQMFGRLKKIEAGKINDPFVYVYEDGYVKKYQIFAYEILDAENEADRAMYRSCSSEASLAAYAQEATERSALDMGVEKVDGNILTLSTCHGAAHGTQKLVVQCTLVSEYQM